MPKLLSYFKGRKQKEIMYVIAGLGNPTKQYEKTRHNIGFDVIDALAEKYNITMNETKFKSICGKGIIGGVKVLLMKPQTFMNLSGESISPMLGYYKVEPEDGLIVIYDDISLDPGFLRIRKKGSAGGHNGIKNIIAQLGTQQFDRIKVGVGKKPADWDLVDHVLGRLSKEDREKVEVAITEAAEAVELMVNEKTDEAMNRYNRKTSGDGE